MDTIRRRAVLRSAERGRFRLGTRLNTQGAALVDQFAGFLRSGVDGLWPPREALAVNRETVEGVCGLHGERSTGVCARCGSFVCSECGPISMCSACLARPGVDEVGQKQARDRAITSLALPFLATAFQARFLESATGRWLLLGTGLFSGAMGVLALVRRPQGATRVVVPATLGLLASVVLSLFAAAFLVGLLVWLPTP